MKKLSVFVLLFVSFNIYAIDVLFNEYCILYNDLVNFDTFGYKSSWDINNNKGSDVINLSQGALTRYGFDTSFAILKEGFFKIKLENDIIGYTRYGDFHIGFGDSESEFTLKTGRYGYKLYDPVIIPNGTVNLKLEINTLYAILFDDTKVKVGELNVYEIDEKMLIRYKDSIFITSNNYDSKIIKDSRIQIGFVEMSNVDVVGTLIRMYIILCELKNNGYNYDTKAQIILMLINNIPILNELSMVKMKLSNDQQQGQIMLVDFGGYNLLKNNLNFY